MEIEPFVNDKKYKMKFTYKNIPIILLIEKVNEEKSCVQLINRGGDFLEFKLRVKELINLEAIKSINDETEN